MNLFSGINSKLREIDLINTNKAYCVVSTQDGRVFLMNNNLHLIK